MTLTAILNNGTRVLGKRYNGDVCAISYANKAQAVASAAKVNGTVVHFGRPFYVKVPAEPIAPTEQCEFCDSPKDIDKPCAYCREAVSA